MFDPERFASGDRAYVNEIVREHSPLVFMVCQSYTTDYDHAQDLFQETWRVVCAKVATFRGEGSFRGWIHRVATNVCLSDVRERKRASDGLDRFARESNGAWSRVDPLRETVRGEFHRALHRALPKLSEGERTAITLRILEGRRPDEVAAIMGIDPATVRSHVRHALNRLRAMMEDPDNELSRYRASP